MTKFLRDLDVWADESIVEDFKGGFVQKFHIHTTCISEHFIKLLSGKVQTHGIAKVLMRFVDSRMKSAKIPARSEGIDVLICEWPFPFLEYQDCSEIARKRMIAEHIFGCLKEVSLSWNWDLRPIEEAHRTIEGNDFVFSGLSKASWLSPNSQFRVRAAFEWNLTEIVLFAVLFQKRSRQEMVRKSIGSLVPDNGKLHDALTKGHGHWISETDFEIITTDFAQKALRVSFAGEMKSQ
jgi:hypothetical protein